MIHKWEDNIFLVYSYKTFIIMYYKCNNIVRKFMINIYFNIY